MWRLFAVGALAFLTMAGVAEARCTITTSKPSFAIPAEYSRPEMMAIGDSIYNGVSSLTLNKNFAAKSPPRQVADQLRLKRFTHPEYPRPVMFELEPMFRTYHNTAIRTVSSSLQANIDAWETDRRTVSSKRPLFHDNIAVAQMETCHLSETTPAGADAKIAELMPDRRSGFRGLLPPKMNLLDWYYNLNARFVLNPRNDPRLDGLSALDQVWLRQPKRLLINIGNNDGVWKMAFLARLPDYDYDKSGPELTIAEELAGIPERMAAIVRALPPEIENVYINNLIRPSAIANLMPVRGAKRLPSGYYDRYENWMGTEFRARTGAEVQAMDDLVARVNDEMTVAVRQATADRRTRFHFVDLFAFSRGLDYKNGFGEQIKVDDFILDNRVIEPFGGALNPLHHRIPVKFKNSQCTYGDKPPHDFVLCPSFFGHGGLFSLDNMHPSPIGYAVMAQEILDTITRTESLPPTRIDLAALKNENEWIIIRSMPNIARFSLVRPMPLAEAEDISSSRPLQGEASRDAVQHLMQSFNRTQAR